MPRHQLDLSSGLKTCPRCETTKPLSEFHKSKSTLHGYQVYCKQCGYERHNKWRRENLDKMRDASKKWRAENPELARDYGLKTRYGLPIGGYKTMLDAQGGRCACCGSETAGGMGQFHVDHCHDTGRIRGLLCHGCNVSLGHFKHDPAILEAAIAYLSRT